MDTISLKPTTKMISRSIIWKTEARMDVRFPCGKTLKGKPTNPRHETIVEICEAKCQDSNYTVLFKGVKQIEIKTEKRNRLRK